MSDMRPFGHVLIVVGLVSLAAGLFLSLGPRVPLLGKLPGDFVVERSGFRLYLPLASSLLLSLLLSALLWLFRR